MFVVAGSNRGRVISTNPGAILDNKVSIMTSNMRPPNILAVHDLACLL